MTDVSLFLKVDATEVKNGTVELDKLAAAGARAEKVNENLSQSAYAVGRAIGLFAVAASAAVGATVLMVKNAINTADAMNDLHLKTGLAFKDLAAYDQLARQNGTSIQGVANGFKYLSKYMVEHSDKLKSIGVTSKDANIAMGQFADAISSIKDPATRTSLAMAVLQRGGTELLPMLMGGSAAFKQAQDQTAAYAIALEGVAPKADQFNDGLVRMSIASKVVGLTLADKMLPSLLAISDAMLESSTNSGLVEKWATTGAALLKGFAVAAVNVAYTLNQIGDSLGGTAAQFAAMLSGDFKSVGIINDEMNRRSASARIEVDRMTASILGAGKSTEAGAQSTKKYNTELEATARKMLERKSISKDPAEDKINQLQREADIYGLTAAQVVVYDTSKMKLNATQQREVAWLVENMTAREGLIAKEKEQIQAEKELEKTNQDIRTSALEAQRIIADIDPVYKATLAWEHFASLIGKGLTEEQAGKAYAAQFGKNMDQMTEFAKKAAANIQDAFAQFLFDPFKGGLSGMLAGFEVMLRKMAAEAVAANLLQAIGVPGITGGGAWGTGAGVSDWLGGLFGSGGGGVAANAGSIDLSYMGLPGFASGTDYVPRDMVARIHQGEKIIPAAQNQGGGSINITVNVASGTPETVRRAAGQGAREALSAFNMAGRYA